MTWYLVKHRDTCTFFTFCPHSLVSESFGTEVRHFTPTPLGPLIVNIKSIKYSIRKLFGE